MNFLCVQQQVNFINNKSPSKRPRAERITTSEVSETSEVFINTLSNKDSPVILASLHVGHLSYVASMSSSASRLLEMSACLGLRFILPSHSVNEHLTETDIAFSTCNQNQNRS